MTILLRSLFVLVGVFSAGFAHAERINNPVAVFSGLDKITGRIETFDVYVDETVKFRQLEITPKACYSRPVTEEPRTTTFVEIDEITLDRRIKRIFTGWMFAESPGLNALENAVSDVWLIDCKMTSDVPPPPHIKQKMDQQQQPVTGAETQPEG